MLNLIILMGRATKDPMHRAEDVKSNYKAITNFDIAVDNIGGDDSTSFFAVTCFGKVAENVAKFVKKGSKIAVTGRIQQRSYLTRDGQKRSTYDIIADSVEFLDPKPEEPSEPNLDEIPVEELGNEVSSEEEKEEPKEPAFDPYTGKPLKPKAKK